MCRAEHRAKQFNALRMSSAEAIQSLRSGSHGMERKSAESRPT